MGLVADKRELLYAEELVPKEIQLQGAFLKLPARDNGVTADASRVRHNPDRNLAQAQMRSIN